MSVVLLFDVFYCCLVRFLHNVMVTRIFRSDNNLFIAYLAIMSQISQFTVAVQYLLSKFHNLHSVHEVARLFVKQPYAVRCREKRTVYRFVLFYFPFLFLYLPFVRFPRPRRLAEQYSVWIIIGERSWKNLISRII